MIDIRDHGMGGGQEDNKINIYCQPTEPVKKDGIWIQSHGVNDVKEVIVDSDIYTSGSWVIGKRFANMPTKRTEFGCVEVNSKIYCIGSMYGQNPRPEMEIYDTLLDKWSRGENMPKAKSYFGCTSVGDKIYCIGGSDGFECIADLHIYDTKTNKWATGAYMPSVRRNFGCVSIGSKIYCIGGEGDYGKRLDYLEIYDTVTGKWSKGKSMPIQIQSFGCASIGSKIYCIGGLDEDVNWLSTVMIYDTVTDTWNKGKDMLDNRKDFVCVSVGSKIYCMGSRNIYIYNILSNTWSIDKDILPVREGARSALVGNKIYYIGGSVRNEGDVSLVEAYSLISKQYLDGQVIIQRADNINGRYNTQLLSTSTKITGVYNRFSSSFDNIWLFKDADLKEYPTYIGDGTKWTKIKN